MSSELTLHVAALAGFVLDTPQMIGLELEFNPPCRSGLTIPLDHLGSPVRISGSF